MFGNKAEREPKGIGMVNTYNIFISHSWSYSGAYESVAGFFDNHPYFYWKDYSVPKDDPIHHARTNAELERALAAKIAHASCVVVLGGVYSSYSEWISKEIALAKSMGKPIIGVRPWGADRMSALVQDNADVIVGWNSDSIVNAVRDYSV